MSAALEEIYNVSPRQAKKAILHCFEAGLVPNLLASPGTGKSSIYAAVAREQRLKMIDHRASTSAPEDFTGLPEFYNNDRGERRARFVPFEDIFPVVGTPLDPMYQGWLLFLDEFNSAPKSIQAPGYKLVLDRMTGQFPLAPNVAIGMAGNLIDDGAIVEELSTAMKSRIITYRMKLVFNEWEEDIAIPNKYDHRLLAWLYTDKTAITEYDADTVGDAFSCARTIEFLDRLLKVKPNVEDSDGATFAGAIGAARAATFIAHLRVYSQIPTIRDILSDPLNCRLPHDKGQAFAVLGMLTAHDDMKNDLSGICQYVDRFTIDQKIMFFRLLGGRTPELASNPEFRKGAIGINRYLNPTQVAEIRQAA